MISLTFDNMLLLTAVCLVGVPSLLLLSQLLQRRYGAWWGKGLYYLALLLLLGAVVMVGRIQWL